MTHTSRLTMDTHHDLHEAPGTPSHSSPPCKWAVHLALEKPSLASFQRGTGAQSATEPRMWHRLCQFQPHRKRSV